MTLTSQPQHMIFEIAKAQDALMHTTSAELGVKTSLYLVFSVFMINAAFQISTFAKGLSSIWAGRAIVVSFFAAGIALVGGMALLIAALVRTYRIPPLPELRQYATDLARYQQAYPEAPTSAVEDDILTTLQETIEINIRVNEQKGFWITLGATILLIATPFLMAAACCGAIAFLGKS